MKSSAPTGSKTKTNTIREEARPALVPTLRFPEFRGAQEWENATLGVLSEVVRGGSPRPIDGFLTTAADGLNWLKIGDVDREAKYVTDTAEKVRPEALSKTRVMNPGDLILSNSMSFGRPYILQIETCIHDGWIAITNIAKRADRDFLYYLISAPSSQSYFIDNAAGSGVQNLNADIIKALAVCFPLNAEQQKIAECLSSVDELMAAQARKVDALKTHKKGLMQQLFPREGETQPRLRFPEFESAGEWEGSELGQCLEKVIDYRGKPPPKAESGVPLITAKNVRLGWLDMTADEYIEADAYDGWMTKGIAKAEDILFTTEAPLGNVAMFPSEGRFALGQRIITLRCKTKICAPEFLFQSLLGPEMQATIDFHSTGSTAKGIKSSVFVSLRFRHPKLAEQQRIASCLSNLDALITAESQRIEAFKTHKKGLMQLLFPSLNEAEA